ncbi:hypothetical protein [Pararhodobacter sp. CCB-MM2]|uniref:hypothetical protein n=1 Tax=Pararhodobacter sp. CCB-MM2 TaxID=1786003 RepID=UPI000832C9B4|nr:hypothetical protein [Pararhodobacter sp. CCB-MM2]
MKTKPFAALCAAVTTLGAAQAETVCTAASLRGNWVVSAVAPGGSPTSICEVSVDRRGRFAGDCITTDPDGSGGVVTLTPETRGRLSMRAGCRVIGTFELNDPLYGWTSASIEGWVWAPTADVPTAGRLLMTQPFQGQNLHLIVDLMRRHPNTTPITE